jgi:monooxygenase
MLTKQIVRIEISMTEKTDVLIIGAGLSGIGAACRLKRDCPEKSIVILEARQATGGTWDLFRYPGIRCDTDMYTLGYSFAPFPGDKAIADGDAILDYIQDTAREYKVDGLVHHGHKVDALEWSSERKSWLVTALLPDGEQRQFEASFVHCCSGYYDYDRGYLPDFPGSEDFAGLQIHPQHWPQDLDYSGKKVVIIGSGATAVTLVPNMAKKAAHVTMLQRSPSYVLSQPSVNETYKLLTRFMPRKWAYYLTRWKQIGMAMFIVHLCQTKPDKVRGMLRKHVVDIMGETYPVDEHFNPSYNPFEQRVCFMPDGDMFRTLKSGKAEIVTDHIERFTATGIQLKSGKHIEADIIVTATGLNLLPMAGLTPLVDGSPRPVNESLVYKGMMLSHVPNFSFVVGYTSVPWTLKADMASQYVCRLIKHMDRKGYDQCVPSPEPGMTGTAPLMDISSGYATRSADSIPKQGDKAPWCLHQNYLKDRRKLFGGRLEDGAMKFF